jgi:polyribonucleotide nucleotidyltransferase
MFSVYSEKMMWGGQGISIETGKIARQADGAVVVSYGDTVVLCTCVFAKTPSANADFFPLTINYLEKFYASGRIPGGFLKRESKPSDREVLISRLIDRPIRPLFPDGFFNEVQVTCTTVSYDKECDPGIAAMIGASASLAISGVPFEGPIAGCNVGYANGKFILNPPDADSGKLLLTVAGTKDGILMVESEASELSEDVMLDAVMFGFESFQPILRMIERLKESVGKKTLEVEDFSKKYEGLYKEIEDFSSKDIGEALSIKEKLLRQNKISEARVKTCEEFTKTEGNIERSETVVAQIFEKILSDLMRNSILKEKKRVDGRKIDEIRRIECEVDVLPKVHGSALFTRGETQALVVTTLGSSSDEQIVDDIEGDRKERFLLHYNFLPYSVGEVGRIGAPGRREVGHGKLAWRAIHPVLPKAIDFPYTIRVVSEITESNGSSSMATVCGTSLALMSSGVPLRKPVAGIAMGLIKGLIKGEADYTILSDIIGDEDHLGDMDFKVAGTEDGITALQMDIKVASISRNIIREALAQAKAGRMHILNCMNKVITESRKDLNPEAPRVEVIMIDKDKIKDLIGPGGKMIKEICAKTGAKIDVEDDGTISVFSSNSENLNMALDIIRSIGVMPEVGTVFNGIVSKITDFGAFVAIGGGREGLVHISNISDRRINKVSDVLKVGQKVKVKIIDIDERNRIKLSMKGV